jgi:hypothetical protein
MVLAAPGPLLTIPPLPPPRRPLNAKKWMANGTGQKNKRSYFQISGPEMEVKARDGGMEAVKTLPSALCDNFNL